MPVALGNRVSKRECGLLLVGHGTRDPRGLAEFHDLSRQVAALAHGFHVEPCFLELAQPDIPTAVGGLIERGVRQISIAPLMLFAAGHAKRDIPQAVEKAVAAQMGSGEWGMGNGRNLNSNQIPINYLPALECDPRILELSGQRFGEALAGKPTVDPAETLLLLVARGSSSPEATAMMHRFAELRSKSTPVACVEVCFVAKAQPSLETTLARALDSSFRLIIVQPHLLFAGQVLEQITYCVEKAGAGDNSRLQREWILTGHLGPSPLVAQALVQLAGSLVAQ